MCIRRRRRYHVVSKDCYGYLVWQRLSTHQLVGCGSHRGFGPAEPASENWEVDRDDASTICQAVDRETGQLEGSREYAST